MVKKTKFSFVILLVVIFTLLSGCNKKSNSISPDHFPNQSNTEIPSLIKCTETVDVNNLKYEKINLPKQYPSVAAISVSGDTIYFASGTDRPSKDTAPCLNYIEKLFSCNMNTKKLETVAEIDDGFVQIDWVSSNENWVVYREIMSEFGGPEKVYAINRKNNIKKLVLENEECSECEGVVSNHPFNLSLLQDFLVVPQFSFEVTARNKSGKITDGIFHNSIKLVDLKTNKVKTIFDKTAPLASSAAIFSTSVNSSYLAFNYAEGGKQTIYIYSFDTHELKKLLEVPLMKDLTSPNSFFTTEILLTDDDYIIFDYPKDVQGNEFLKVIAPVENITQMKSLFNSSQNFYLEWPQIESTDYIIWTNRQGGGVLNVINRHSGCLKTTALGIGYPCVINDKVIGEGGALLIIDLKKNGF